MKRILFISFLLFISLSSFSQIDHWETGVFADDTWRYRIGSSEPPANWNSLTFNDASWAQGPGSIGYGDGDDNTPISRTESVYMRHTFAVVDTAKILRAVFSADYDDGFVAYLNGVEIARSNMTGTPPTHDTWAFALHEAQLYQGGQPESYFLSENQVKQLLIQGNNVLAVQTHNYDGINSSDLTSAYWLSFGISDNSNNYRPTPDWFNFFTFTSALPIVKINTNGASIPDEPKIAGEMGIIWNGEGNMNSSDEEPNEFFGNISIELRGQSSLALFPKKSYGFETKDSLGQEDMDVSFLNFPEEEDWILHGPYSDKTLIRNILAMQMARDMGQYASRTRLVELQVNELYEGVYVLMERIKRDDNRIDIAKLQPEDISGDELTGGYVFKIDKGDVHWISNYDVVDNPGRRLAFALVSPKVTDIQPEQFTYIRSYVDSFEQAMLDPDVPFGGKRYDEYIDVTSFAEHFILSELSKDVDAYRISSYLFKDKDSKGGLIQAGPAWDFNIAFGNGDYCNSQLTSGWVYEEHCGTINPFWWGNMFTDEAFQNTAKCRWEDLRQGPLALDSIFAFIDEKAALLAPSVDRNFDRWPVLDQYIWPNRVVTGSYQGEIDSMKSYISRRISWMDANMFGTCVAASNEELLAKSQFRIYPNPAKDVLYLELGSLVSNELEINIWDILGRNIAKPIAPKVFGGNEGIELNLKGLNLGRGMYYVQVLSEGKSLGTEKLQVE